MLISSDGLDRMVFDSSSSANLTYSLKNLSFYVRGRFPYLLPSLGPSVNKEFIYILSFCPFEYASNLLYANRLGRPSDGVEIYIKCTIPSLRNFHRKCQLYESY